MQRRGVRWMENNNTLLRSAETSCAKLRKFPILRETDEDILYILQQKSGKNLEIRTNNFLVVSYFWL